MTLNEYQKAAQRTATTHAIMTEQQAREHDLNHAILGLVTEAGELADVLKKRMAYGKPIDLVNLREEAGDILWYLPLLCRALDCNLEDIARINIEKLKKRYPDKFSQDKALNRDLEGERAVLEGKPAGKSILLTNVIARPVRPDASKDPLLVMDLAQLMNGTNLSLPRAMKSLGYGGDEAAVAERLSDLISYCPQCKSWVDSALSKPNSCTNCE